MSIEAMKQALEALEGIHPGNMTPMAEKYWNKAITTLRTAIEQAEKQDTVLPGGGHFPAVPVAVYGYCPECGGAGVMRERRPNGDDKCTNAHKYPSSKALAEQPAQQPAAFKPFEIETSIEEGGEIHQTVTDLAGNVMLHVLDTQENGVRSALIEMGWTPPQLAQQQEPVANGLPRVIAGAIFDFAGYLITRDTVIEVGSTANASPVADLVKDWAALRGLSLADAAVLSWQEWLTDVRANDTSKERVDEMQKQRHDTTPPQPASKPWEGLTDEEIWDEVKAADLDWQTGWSLDEDAPNRYITFARAIEAKLKEKNT